MINSINENGILFSILHGLAVILSIAVSIALVVPPEWLGFGF